MSSPSFCGNPIMWLKQQSPSVRISSSLCCSLFHTQNGLPCSLVNSSLRVLSFCCCETSLCRSLNNTDDATSFSECNYLQVSFILSLFCFCFCPRSLQHIKYLSTARKLFVICSLITVDAILILAREQSVDLIPYLCMLVVDQVELHRHCWYSLY